MSAVHDQQLHTPVARPPGPRPTQEPVDRLLRDLRTGVGGLSPTEVAKRLNEYGPNALPRARTRAWFLDLARQFTHPLALLLWLAAALSLVTGSPVLCWAILVVIAINALVAFAQERQAAKAIEALSRYLPLQARVFRARKVELISASEIVPGDILLVSEGDRVCADARLIDGDVEIDMSALTGESAPVARSSGDGDTAERLIDAADAVFSGTACTSGAARAVVFDTGAHTQLGRIAALSQRTHADESPLERQVRRTAWLIAGVAIAVGLLFLPLGLLAGLSLTDAAIFAVGLLVANVPEGLLPTITLALAVGVRVLARRGALVKRLSAVETLGSTTVICTDKTGTLTANRMTVVQTWTPGSESGTPSAGLVATEVLADAMADCVDLETSSDPMEGAVRRAAEGLGAHAAAQRAMFRFDPRRKRMSVVVERAGGLVVQVKGAPESVLPLCVAAHMGGQCVELASAYRDSVERVVDDLAARGLRVLAVATRAVAGDPPSNATAAETQLCLLGLIALLDPPRPEVAGAVESCHRAGITVHVITGDHPLTAAEVARQVGIDAREVVSGEHVDRLTDAELNALLAQPGEIVFARSTPEGKLRIAHALHDAGEVVAMTGDGVNDAPALHRADIGVAMGKSGTEVAREAATMVLTDDNFASIVAAIEAGRRAYDNVKKFITYIF